MTDHEISPGKPAANSPGEQGKEKLLPGESTHKLTDFKGKPPRVEVTRHPKDPADTLTTKAMISQYTQEDGFHCPACHAIIKDPEQAVYHLAEEINKAMEKLGRL